MSNDENYEELLAELVAIELWDEVFPCSADAVEAIVHRTRQIGRQQIRRLLLPASVFPMRSWKCNPREGAN